MSSQQSTLLRAQQLRIAIVVAAYFCISISLVFVNKVLLTEGASIPAPLFVTWFQCVITVGICYTFGEIGKTAAPGTFFAQFPKVEYKQEIAKKLLVLSVVFVGMVTFNNLSLKFVEVSFYNVARSLTIVFNVVLTYILLGQSTSVSTMVCLGAVIVGFFVGAAGEVRFSLIGTLFGVTSSLFVSLNSIYTKKVMGLVDNNEWKLSAYNNINAVILFIPLIIFSGELDIISKNSHLLFSPFFWGVMIAGGIFGFLIGIVTVMQIKLTSPLTHNISGTAKACVQTVFAFMIWQNPTTFQNILGIVLVLLGSSAYAWVRNREMAAAPVKSLILPPTSADKAAKEGITSTALSSSTSAAVDTDGGNNSNSNSNENGEDLEKGSK